MKKELAVQTVKKTQGEIKMPFQKWYNELPEHTRVWLDKQPLWHEKDLAIAFVIGLILGTLIGWTL